MLLVAQEMTYSCNRSVFLLVLLHAIINIYIDNKNTHTTLTVETQKPKLEIHYMLVYCTWKYNNALQAYCTYCKTKPKAKVTHTSPYTLQYMYISVL